MKSLDIDRKARQVFDLASVASLKNDSETALKVCSLLNEIEKDYQLSLKGISPKCLKFDEENVKRATREHRCCMCGRLIRIGSLVVSNREFRLISHWRCPEKKP